MISDELDAAHHVPEQADRGHKAAEGVGNVLVHLGFVSAEPVKFRAGIFEALVVGAEGDGVQLLAYLPGAVELHRGAGQGVTAEHHGLGLVAGAAENGSVILAGVLDQVGAGEEAAHAVAEHHIGQAGVLLHRPVMKLFHIPQHIVPAIPGGEKAQVLRAVDGFTVPQMVVGHHEAAVLGQKLHKLSVAVDMLRNTVGDLDNGLGVPIGQAFQSADTVHAGG